MNLILPRTGEEPGEHLAGYSPPHGSTLDLRVNQYQRAKARSLQMLSYMRSLLEETPKDLPNHERLRKDVERLQACGTWLLFHYYYGWLDGEFEDKTRLIQANFCNQTLKCNFCAIRRAVIKMRIYYERFEHIMAERPFLTPHLITLTVKNGPDLMERFNHLRKSYGILKRRRENFLKRGKGLYTEFAKVTGGSW